ncbi:hypothetical protein ABW19_dt0208860 [Dactylella cylindrospora]|nr:hypothetical protein ABW19_dt0208860 [Dactylella cylindrospora]
MAKLLLSRSKSESRLRKSAKDAAKSSESLAPPQNYNEPLPSPQYVPRQMESLNVDIYSSPKRSMDVSRPKTSGGRNNGSSKGLTEISAAPNVEERPKTSHGTKKGNALEEPNFSILNRSYTWSREQTGQSSRPTVTRQASSPMLHAFPPRSSSRQQQHPANCEIGVALGSPTHHPKTLSDARSSRMYAPDALFTRSLPQHYVSLETNITSTGSSYGSPVVSHAESKEDSSKGGWKKFFGKGLFKKTPQKPQLSQASQSSISSASTAVSSQDTKVSMDSLVEEIAEAEALYQPPPQPEPEPQQKTEISARLLDVDIPKVEMERYSVMFDSLLNHGQQQQKPSIYARRKSGIGGAAIGQKISENPAATPTLNLPPKKDSLPLGVNKSPLWLFPATPRTPKSPGRPRAMTTPTESTTNMANPSTTPELNVTKKSRPESDIMPSLLMMLEDRNERNLSRNERVPPTPFSVISEGSELDSPYSPDIQATESNAPWIRKFSMIEEPEWEMVTTTPLRPRTPSPTELEEQHASEAYVAKAATISIARQISISQRQLLLPVISNPERFVSRSRSVKSTAKTETPLVIKPVRPEVVSPAPTSAVSNDNIALAL